MTEPVFHLNSERLIHGHGEVFSLANLTREPPHRAYRAQGVLRHGGGLRERRLRLLRQVTQATSLPHRDEDQRREGGDDHEGESVRGQEHERQTDDGGGQAAQEHGEILRGDVLEEVGVRGEPGDEAAAGDCVEESNLLLQYVGEEPVPEPGHDLVGRRVEEVGPGGLEDASEEADKEYTVERFGGLTLGPRRVARHGDGHGVRHLPREVREEHGAQRGEDEEEDAEHQAIGLALALLDDALEVLLHASLRAAGGGAVLGSVHVLAVDGTRRVHLRRCLLLGLGQKRGGGVHERDLNLWLQHRD